jgi:hypothetical protein
MSSTSADAGVVGDTKVTVTVRTPGEVKVNVEHGAAGAAGAPGATSGEVPPWPDVPGDPGPVGALSGVGGAAVTELGMGTWLALASVSAGGAGVSWAEVVGLSLVGLAVVGVADVGGVKVLVAGADAAVGVVPCPHPIVNMTSAVANAAAPRLRAGISVV